MLGTQSLFHLLCLPRIRVLVLLSSDILVLVSLVLLQSISAIFLLRLLTLSIIKDLIVPLLLWVAFVVVPGTVKVSLLVVSVLSPFVVRIGRHHSVPVQVPCAIFPSLGPIF